MKPVKYLALDFDGVVADSILECLVTAHNAFSKHLGRDDFRKDLQGFSQGAIRRFRATRSFIRRGEDYVYLLQAAHEKVALNKQQDFDTFTEANEGLRQVYRERFYGQRQLLQQQYPEEWLALNRHYKGFKTFLRKLKTPESIFIVTTKDITSVEMILQSAGIQLLQGNMFQATKTYRKPDIINDILVSRKIAPDAIRFIDDHAGTVIEVSEQTDVVCYFAQWGYHSQTQLELMQDSRSEMLSRSGFLERYKYLTTSKT